MYNSDFLLIKSERIFKMPELPEVETVMRGLEATVKNQSISRLNINRYDLRIPIPQDFRQCLTNQTINTLTRRGKYIIFHMSAGHVAILHLGMSGRVRIFKDSEAYKAEKHDHVVVYLESGSCFVFNDPRRFGMFYLSSDTLWYNEGPFEKMGPEPLDKTWAAPKLHKAIKTRKAPIKAALLDQHIVAGLGNIYVCEALYRSGIHPTRPSNTLTMPETKTLTTNIKDVLREAIKAGGSTLRDYQHTDGSLGYFQHGFAVYDQEGTACKTAKCKGRIERIVQSGRSTFFCPSCQH